ncbi:hypothetical protein G6F32_016729 [Rhizopus arrhizus]|nr:hypothetical protein G6F32_016729 [Rhizopus arrhizus]
MPVKVNSPAPCLPIEPVAPQGCRIAHQRAGQHLRVAVSVGARQRQGATAQLLQIARAADGALQAQRGACRHRATGGLCQRHSARGIKAVRGG